jgi:hypothetical protein
VLYERGKYKICARKPCGQLSASGFFRPITNPADVNDEHHQRIRLIALRQRRNKALTSGSRLIHRQAS